MSYLQDSAAQLKVFEADVPWPYLDTKSNVTFAVGFMAPDLASFLTYSWMSPDGCVSDPADVATAWRTVSAMLPGRVAGYYHYPGCLTLPQAARDGLLMAKLTTLDGQLSAAFDDYEGFPEPAKLALIDMVWNLGFEGLMHGYPRLDAAVKIQDWKTCALECYRNGPDLARNDWTKAQFLAAA